MFPLFGNQLFSSKNLETQYHQAKTDPQNIILIYHFNIGKFPRLIEINWPVLKNTSVVMLLQCMPRKRFGEFASAVSDTI